MTIGISKKNFQNLLACIEDITCNFSPVQKMDLEALLLEYSEELNPWLPIDENTPKDRRILLLYPAMLDTPSVTGLWNALKGRFVADIVIHGSIRPTHWQELPEDPKGG